MEILDSSQRQASRKASVPQPNARSDPHVTLDPSPIPLTDAGQTEGRVILSGMVWKVGTHLRLRLAWRMPALMIGNGADSPSSIRWRRLECDAIDGPTPSVEQHHTGDVDCAIGWFRAAGQCETAAFWLGNESPIEVQLIECSAYYVEYNET